jgi:metallophosphoesterase superfamily enzyme
MIEVSFERGGEGVTRDEMREALQELASAINAELAARCVIEGDLLERLDEQRKMIERQRTENRRLRQDLEKERKLRMSGRRV